MCDLRCSCPTCTRLADRTFALAQALAQLAATNDRLIVRVPDFSAVAAAAFAGPPARSETTT